MSMLSNIAKSVSVVIPRCMGIVTIRCLVPEPPPEVSHGIYI